MLLRALLVILVVVNVGVGAWWASRPPPAPPAPVEAPAGVPRLQLLDEVPRPARPVPAVASRPAPPEACATAGPFDTPAALRRAVAQAQSRGWIVRTRETVVGTPRGWRVQMPPQPSREDAQAVADRIAAAGLSDWFILSAGPERNAIALGRFGSEDAARRRQAELAAAGFDARVEPLGDAARQAWVDLGAGQALDLARLAQDVGAPAAQPLDCTRLR